jgi:site-specific recombinase XerD
MLKRYSRKTINCYKRHLQLVRFQFKERSFKSISDKELFDFIYHWVTIKKNSASYQRQILGALKLIRISVFLETFD